MARNNVIFLFVGILLVILLSNGILFVTFPRNIPGAVIAIDDAEISQRNPNSVVGNHDWAEVQSLDPSGDTKLAYFKFPIRSDVIHNVLGGGSITEASLNLRINKVRESSNAIISEVSNNWDEATLTWTNKPQHENEITRRHVSVSDEDEHFQFTGISDYIERKIREGSTEVSFVVSSDDFGGSRGFSVRFDTKDNFPELHPYLILFSEPPNCSGDADTNCDEEISFLEINLYAQRWVNGEITFRRLINAATQWVNQ